jgi:hypothetical protein
VKNLIFNGASWYARTGSFLVNINLAWKYSDRSNRVPITVNDQEQIETSPFSHTPFLTTNMENRYGQ